MPISRRGFLVTPAALAQVLPPRRSDNATVSENARQGTPDWQLEFTRHNEPGFNAGLPAFTIKSNRSQVIEGFASKTSVAPGQSIDFKVSVDPPGEFRIDIYRMGYYQGWGGRHYTSLGPFQGKPQELPMMKMERVRECAWEKCATFTVPSDWPSGVYLAKLTRADPPGFGSYIIFVVKQHRKSEILFQVSDLTWQAYNLWPGADSLYTEGTRWYTGPNVRVSFDRPYAKFCQYIDAPLSTGSGEFLLWEHPMTYWLEQQGYDVTYCSNLDLHVDPDILKTAKAFISIGHDEYWSRKMFEEALKARDEGLSFAFFSGNSISGEIIFYESSVTGEPCRVIARKEWARFPDEDRLMGVKSFGPAYGDWVVTKPGHWIYEGTGMKAGEAIKALIGWEYHGIPAKIDGLEVVAESMLYLPRKPTVNENVTENGRHSAVIYPGAKGNWVFNAGTIWWSEGLAYPPGHIAAGNSGFRTHGPDPRVQRITRNLLDRMLKDSPR